MDEIRDLEELRDTLHEMRLEKLVADGEIRRLTAQIDLAKKALESLAKREIYLSTRQLNGTTRIELILNGVPWFPWDYAIHILDVLELENES